MNDYLLILRIKSGDSQAWEVLVNKYYDQIFAYCVRRCYGNRVLAADLSQDIFLKLIENIDRYHFSGKFFNYLFTIAVNTCHNYHKKKRLETVTYEEYQITEDRASFDMLNKNESIQKALDSLNEDQKDAIILKYYLGFKVKEIAKITDTSVPTAQSRINQGLKKLEKFLDREEFEHD
ncbi:RNA polymerase sigma factor [Enterococcus sp.]|uniref:RNA polymerase sigma factor n=1 Tax=Enterococcus sp. TaxID=35783 RepID=UPI002915A2D4|nr:RNA polymerase sigma factor [Enterococcus sp.]MDU5336622.1 RNA polymerase sigma factor [Enterococcus sp.]